MRGPGVLLCQVGQSHVLWVDLSSGARIGNAYQFAGTAGSSTNVNPKYYPTNHRTWNETYNALGPFTSVVGLHPGSDDGIRMGRTPTSASAT